MKIVSGRNSAITSVIILICDLCMLFAAVAFFRNGKVDFEGLIISVIAIMSSFGPVTALANLGSTLQNTFAAGNRVLVSHRVSTMSFADRIYSVENGRMS